jgi:nucleoside 2-deoxyribosyltransferase
MKRIYLAGPDVFFSGAAAHFDALEARCRSRGLHGVRPADGGLSQGLGGSGDEVAARIYQANLTLIRGCDGLLANLMPFRNALEPDSGTVFEVGFAVALGKPVSGFLPRRGQSYEAKVTDHCGLVKDASGLIWDRDHGYLVEAFGQPMNLMLSCSARLYETFDEALHDLALRLESPG